ncbi:hypothetical protein ACHAWF_006804 [Thalassiosira exigua]
MSSALSPRDGSVVARLMATACARHDIPFATTHCIDALAKMVHDHFAHPEGIIEINSFVTRELEEEKIKRKCKDLGVEYLPPKQQETTTETTERWQSLAVHCQAAESKIQRKSPPEPLKKAPQGIQMSNRTEKGTACAERSFLLVGTLCYSEDGPTSRRIHIIAGTWSNFPRQEIQYPTPPQYFKLSRTIPPNEDLKELPKDGKFRSSFLVGNDKVKDSGVNLAFVAKEGEQGTFSVKGTGSNKFGTFEIDGTATTNSLGMGDPYSVTLRKRYTTPAGEKSGMKKQLDEKRKHAMKNPPESHGHGTNECKSTYQSSPRSVLKFASSASPNDVRDPRQIIIDDARLAASLQKEESRLAQESDDMLTTAQGIAYKFVESILKECKSIPQHQNIIIEPVAVDDMVHQAEGLLKCKETFESVGKVSIVDLGFHFTDESRLEHIRRDGLMTIADRHANPKLNIEQSRRTHGRFFGDGVYTGNDPCILTKYGDIGLVVARIKGNTRRIKPEEVALEGTLKKPSHRLMVPVGQEALAHGFDSLIGNKSRDWRSLKNQDEIILLRSAQCIPLIRFPASVLSNHNHDGLPSILHPWIKSTEKVVTRFFNNDPPNISSRKRLFDPLGGDGASRAKKKLPALHNAKQPSSSQPQQVTFMLPNASQRQAGTSQTNNAQAYGKTGRLPVSNVAIQVIPTGGGMQNRATSTMVPHATTTNTAHPGKKGSPTAQSDIMIYIAPENLLDTRLVEKLDGNTVLNDETCVVCMEKLNKSDDLRRSLQHSRKCPSCQVLIGEPQGKSPSGQMIISVDHSIHCAGYSNVNTILIHYILPDGKQKDYHEDPGELFKGIQRLAFLPNNDDGHRLLARLKYAFLHGLTFRVGTSITTGKSSVVTWASIHHKTSPSGTSHGWPDETYFVRCNEELDCLGVPKADDCKLEHDLSE